MEKTIARRVIIYAAQHCYEWTYAHLTGPHKIDPEIAKAVAKDAADALGNALLRDLPVNGVEVVE